MNLPIRYTNKLTVQQRELLTDIVKDAVKAIEDKKNTKEK